MGDDGERRGESRISWRTLLIASMASVAAAFVVSALWAPGTLIGAAVTPVIVALVSELLRKPIEAVPSPSAALSPLRPGVGGPPPEAQEHAHEPVSPPAAGGEPVVHRYPRSDYRTWDRRRIKLALVTGALAFAIAVAFFVVADLTTGSAVTGRGGGSSLFSPREGDSGGSKPATTTTTPRETTTQPGRTSQSAPPAQQTTEQQAPTTSETPAPRTTEEPVAPQTSPAPATPPAGGAAPLQEQQTTP